MLGYIVNRHDMRVIKWFEDLSDDELEALQADATRLLQEGAAKSNVTTTAINDALHAAASDERARRCGR